MGIFPPPAPETIVDLINMISSVGTLMGDPWVLLNLAKVETFGDTMPLSSAKFLTPQYNPSLNLPFVFHKKSN